jgi:flavin reductase (DIM6/NTAB) family NADH-FMN oxidoreductase RutF
MRSIDPKGRPIKEVHGYLIGGICPRPIALVGTVAEDGTPNLAPFSFFNAFGANPPIVAFSAARSGRTGKCKDTYNNLVATKECTIQLVPYAMVDQVNLASTELPPEVDEYDFSGLTPVPSEDIRPFRVAESPFQMECKLQQMVCLGDQPASGNLAICEVIRFHIAEELFGDDGTIDPRKLDFVGRNGKNIYTRASGDALFEVDKP